MRLWPLGFDETSDPMKFGYNTIGQSLIPSHGEIGTKNWAHSPLFFCQDLIAFKLLFKLILRTKRAPIFLKGGEVEFFKIYLKFLSTFSYMSTKLTLRLLPLHYEDPILPKF